MRSIAQLRAEGFDIRINADEYESVEDSINAGQIEDVPFGDLEQCNSIEINNDTTDKDLIVRLNGKLKDLTVKGNESKTIENILITSVKLYNNSGSTINYRIHMWGV
jgi:hypothetical protein